MGKVEEFTLPIKPLSQSPRKVWVYLPNSYDTSDKYYPVLYMFDGHNLFFDELATYGTSWGLKDYLDNSGLDLVVVGVDCNHIGNRRDDEYTPFTAVRVHNEPMIHPRGKQTAEWFAGALKRECEKRYRILSEREHVGIAGSSMGGLMAEYCITAYNHIYSKAACLSPATFLNEKKLEKLILETEFDPNTRIYMDMGSEESRNRYYMIKDIDLMLTINHFFTEQGCHTFPNLVVKGEHTEASWANMMPMILEFMYPELY